MSTTQQQAHNAPGDGSDSGAAFADAGKASGTTQTSQPGGAGKEAKGSRTSVTDDSGQRPPSLSEKQRRELWMYIAVSIVAVELLVAVGALFYGFLSAGAAGTEARFTFPWLSWGAVAVIAPSLILLAVHLADVGLFRQPVRGASDKDWQRLLPSRMQKLYLFIKGAPVIVILLGIVGLGAALMTLDGAFSAFGRIASALVPYIPHIAITGAVVLCVLILAVVWLHYRTRRLVAEYEFRREVLERTGVIIVDKGSTALPPGGIGDVPFAITAGGEANGAGKPALPPGADYKDSEVP
ncbi:hypothetical protein LJC59_03340 [Desulfovibrio sp. OttesenSCG-928-A18]|nr:hypothetical protein [Desulfovibrio sp. OttesenSCG-928-A18]